MRYYVCVCVCVSPAITDPRPGHDFGNVKSFTFDYSYWSTTSVSVSVYT